MLQKQNEINAFFEEKKNKKRQRLQLQENIFQEVGLF